MISREELAKEYVRIINNYYPVVSRLLNQCLIKILTLNNDRANETHYYLGIYYPHRIGKLLLAQQTVLYDAAENLGLVEVIFIDINSLVKDPYSKIRQQDFRFWLELCWSADTAN